VHTRELEALAFGSLSIVRYRFLGIVSVRVRRLDLAALVCRWEARREPADPWFVEAAEAPTSSDCRAVHGRSRPWRQTRATKGLVE
jgi:hypothetical protein